MFNVLWTLTVKPEINVPGGLTKTTDFANHQLYVVLSKLLHHLHLGHQHVMEILL